MSMPPSTRKSRPSDRMRAAARVRIAARSGSGSLPVTAVGVSRVEPIVQLGDIFNAVKLSALQRLQVERDALLEDIQTLSGQRIDDVRMLLHKVFLILSPKLVEDIAAHHMGCVVPRMQQEVVLRTACLDLVHGAAQPVGRLHHKSVEPQAIERDNKLLTRRITPQAWSHNLPHHLSST